MRVMVAEFELIGGIATPLAADTLWGHLCWGLRYAAGEAALIEWLRSYDEGQPPLVISDPLPSGFWPVPAIPPAPLPSNAPSLDEFDRRKKLSKTAWISHEQWNRLAGAVSHDSLARAVAADGEPQVPEFVAIGVTHAGINRLTGGTAQEGGGLLYTNEQRYSKAATRWDVWLRTTMSDQQLHDCMNAGLSGGYGRDGSSGLGDLRLIALHERALPQPAGANAGVLLSPATPSPSDPSRGFTPLGVRCGRLGGLFAGQPTPSGSTVRQKRPVLVIERGSVLIATPPPAVAGRVLSGVHEDPAIRHYSTALMLPCVLSESLLTQAAA